MGFFIWGPPKCGLCGRTTNCRCHDKDRKRDTRTVTSKKGKERQVSTGNYRKNGHTWCGKCGSRIVNGKHSGRCQ